MTAVTQNDVETVYSKNSIVGCQKGLVGFPADNDGSKVAMERYIFTN